MPYLAAPPHVSGTLAGRPQPQLRSSTGRTVTLRPWHDADGPDLVAAYADPQIQRWHCRSLDPDEALALVRRWNHGWTTETRASWAVTDPETDRLLGRVGFRAMDLSESSAEIAYWVMPFARGQGVATAAVTELCRWAFLDVGFQRLTLEHSVGNPASCQVAEATGFQAEGTKRASTLHADGCHDMHTHARLRTDRP